MRRALAILWAVALLMAAPGIASAAENGIVAGTVSPVSIAPEVEVCVVEALPSEICATPNVSGAYSILHVPTGPNRIEFLPSHGSGYLPQYYKFVNRLAEATTIIVPPGPAPAGEIDAALEMGGELTGTVTAAPGAAPLRGAEVCALEAASGARVACAETDAGGGYSIGALPGGSYKVVFRGEGVSAEYASTFYGGAATLGAADVLAVEPGQVRSGVDAALVKGAQITGTVSAAVGGGRLAGIPVCLLATGTATPTRCVLTGPLGDYALQGIAAGSYQVGFSLSAPTIGGEAVQAENDGYLTQYFDGVANRSEARILGLSGEQVVGGVDAALLTPTPPAPPALPVPAGNNVVPAPVQIAEPTKPAQLKCKKGFVKRKVKQATKCVKQPVKKHRKKTKKHGRKPGKHGKHHKQKSVEPSGSRR